jgi:hypothetical protein
MIDLLKTPLAEPIAKVGADLIVRNMDFAGASDLADRLMPTNPAGMDKAMQNLPKEAQGIVKAIYQQMTALQGELEHTKLELKYKTGIELGWMNVEREKNKNTADTKVHDTEIRARTAMHDTVVKAEASKNVAEIQAGAQLLNTHAEAAHNKEAAEIALKAAEKAEKGTNGAGASNG